MKINTNYNFSYETKKEICTYYLNNDANLIYLIFAYLNNIAEYIKQTDGYGFEFQTTYIDIIKLFKFYFKEEQINIYVSNKKSVKYNNTKYKVILNLNDDSFINQYNDFFKTFRQWTIEQKQAFMCGLFLSSGSIANPVLGNNHLEFRILLPKSNEFAKAILEDFDIKFLEIKHHKRHVIYSKKLQNISDILKLLNAHNNMFLLEEHRISNDLVNTFQRLTNLDISNLSKTIKANDKMNYIISSIQKTPHYYKLSHAIKRYCELKLKYPTYTMNELLEELNKILPEPVTKSWINHTNIKLRKLYNSFGK